MKNRKTTVIVIIILICVLLEQFTVKIIMQDRQKSMNDIDLNIQNLDMVSQCFWGTWVMTAQLHGEYGWGECHNGLQGMSVKFTPTSFTFQNDYSEVSAYSCSLIAIADISGYYREAGQFQELGLEGDYYLEFYPEWDNREDEIGCSWEYILVSETELLIPEARNGMYRMEKVKEYFGMEEEMDYLRINPFRSIYYGIWEVTEELGAPNQFVNTGDTLETRGEPNSFDFCRILDRNEKNVDEIAELIKLGDKNKYVVYCKFSEDYFWDYMIIKDGMTAVLIKGKCIYQVQRISDPEEDGIYYELG